MTAVIIRLDLSEAQGGTGAESLEFGPFEHIQITYECLRCDENGPVFYCKDGLWYAEMRVRIGDGPWESCGPNTETIGYTDLIISGVPGMSS